MALRSPRVRIGIRSAHDEPEASPPTAFVSLRGGSGQSTSPLPIWTLGRGVACRILPVGGRKVARAGNALRDALVNDDGLDGPPCRSFDKMPS